MSPQQTKAGQQRLDLLNAMEKLFYKFPEAFTLEHGRCEFQLSDEKRTKYYSIKITTSKLVEEKEEIE